MNLIATALVMGIIFLPGGSASTPAPAITSAAQNASGSTSDDPSPSKAAPAKTAEAAYQVKVTGYNAVPEQTDGDPSITASGVKSNSDTIAARSVDLADELPFGTVVKVTREGSDNPSCNFHKVESLIGYRVIADTMNARWTNRVDIELDSTDTVKVDGVHVNPARALGVCGNVKVTVVGRLPISQIPHTQAALAQLYAPQQLALNK